MDFRTGRWIIINKSGLWWNWASARQTLSLELTLILRKKKKSVVDWQGWIAELIGHMCGFMEVKEEGMMKKKTETTLLPVMQNMNLSGRYCSLFVFQLMTAPR